MTCRPPLSPVLKKSAVHVARAAMTVAVHARVLTVLHPVALVAPKAAMRPPPMAATSL
jgi:hypothetical protein